MKEERTALSMSHISKSFGEVKVLDDVNMDLRTGEVHALIGANGAGKSTLMKILNGIYSNYEGEIVLNGKKVSFGSPWDAQQQGISMIHQELDLVMTMDVASNIYLGRELFKKHKISGIDRLTMQKNAQELLDRLHFDIRADSLAGDLSPANQQLALIARSVSTDADVIVMDEPTSSLSHQETLALFEVIRQLKALGKSIIYISHFLDEIFEVSDRVTVLRDGKKVATAETSGCTTGMLVEWMIGRPAEFDKKYIREKLNSDIVLEVKHYAQKHGAVDDISFQLHRGEVLGLAGVVGSGRTELAKMLFGAEPIRSGELFLENRKITIDHPAKAVAMDIALVPEERKKEGLIQKRSIADNISVIDYKNHTRLKWIRYREARARAAEMIDYMHVICSGMDQEVTDLSGGNQQKVVMGRCLSVRPKVLILDQPTRGVDVGAKNEIYKLITALAEDGMAILLISDELEELLNLSDRILVMRRGKITNEFDNHSDAMDKNRLLTAMVG